MTMCEKIKNRRLELGMTLEEVGEKVGVGKSTVRKWETGDIKNMRRDKIAALASALGVTPGYLMGWDDTIYPVNLQPMSAIKPHAVPLIGSVAAGEPIFAENHIECYVQSPADADYALSVKGNSMYPNYQHGGHCVYQGH